MKHLFKPIFTAVVLLGSLADKSNAQTEYGNGAGKLGPERAFFGTDAGKMNGSNNTVGAFNTYIGHFAGKNAYGQQNTFIGNSAGMLNTTGQSNTFIGYSAGKKNDQYVQNTLVGSRAGMLSTGSQNSYFGDQAGIESTGSNNVFLGFRAGNFNKFGDDNVFIGAQAGHLSAKGQNVFIGTEAGYKNESEKNVFIGWQAGNNATSTWPNIYIGNRSGSNAKGGANTFIGTSAGENAGKAAAIVNSNTFIGAATGQEADGHSNSYIGTGAGKLTKGDRNVMLGAGVGTNSNGSNNVLIGVMAGINSQGSDNNFLGKESGHMNASGAGNTFLGTTTGFNNDSGMRNAFVGNNAGYSNKSGNYNTFLGFGAGYDNSNGEKNTYLGCDSGGGSDLVNATAIGASAKVFKSNSIILGHRANVGIGIAAPDYQLHLNREAAAKAGSSDWTVASDSRLKKNVTDFNEGLDLLRQIRPVWFQYNGKAGIETGEKRFVGIIAQEMQKIAPYMIGKFTHQDTLGNKTEYLDYDANAVTYILINSVKEQQKIIEEKESEIQDLAKRLEQLERIVASGTIKPLTGNSAARQEPNANGVMLEQNAPNGFSQSTAIGFFIPQSVKEAVINVYSIEGVEVGSYPVKERGESSLTLSAEQFANGVFVYDLVTDGKSNGAKKMMVNK